jgi:hypothetical protein
MDSTRFTVKSVSNSRYSSGVCRPQNWEQRVSGVETVTTECGKTLRLFCDGQQSTPQPGWVIVVDSKSVREDGSVNWTLFGMPKGVNTTNL